MQKALLNLLVITPPPQLQISETILARSFLNCPEDLHRDSDVSPNLGNRSLLFHRFHGHNLSGSMPLFLPQLQQAGEHLHLILLPHHTKRRKCGTGCLVQIVDAMVDQRFHGSGIEPRNLAATLSGVVQHYSAFHPPVESHRQPHLRCLSKDS